MEIINFNVSVNFLFLDFSYLHSRRWNSGMQYAPTELIIPLNKSWTCILKNSIYWYLTLKIVVRENKKLQEKKVLQKFWNLARQIIVRKILILKTS